MADINLAGLPENSVSDANDYLIINKAGVDYKQKAGDLLIYNNYPWSNTALLTDQVDNLTQPGSYMGLLNSYNHQTETGVPGNVSFYVIADVGTANYKAITIKCINDLSTQQINTKNGGVWSGWKKLITTADKATWVEVVPNTYFSATTSMAYTGISFSVTETCVVSVALSYSNSYQKGLIVADKSTSPVTHAYITMVNPEGLSSSYMWGTGVLPPGTYYIWAKSASAASNAIQVRKLVL